MPYKDRDVRRAKNLEYRALRIAEIHEYLGGKCAVCGTTEELEIHHKDQSQKKFNPSQRWSTRWDKLVVELDKCEIRCFTHHNEVHESKHGTLGRFSNYGCRCDECVTAFREYDRIKHARYRQEKKLGLR